MNFEQLEKIMQDNPGGCLVQFSKGRVSAAHWMDKDVKENILQENLISGICQNGIDSGRFTKKQIIESLSKTLVQRLAKPQLVSKN